MIIQGDLDLPPALSPLEADLHFDDITSQGIHFSRGPLNGYHRLITVTISCKRPPKFMVVSDDDTNGYDQRYAPKRRATAMDFALTRTVRICVYRADYPRLKGKLVPSQLYLKVLVDW